MTRPHNNPWRHHDREYLTDHQKVELFMEKGGRCHRCTRKIRAGEEWIAEHFVALQNGGTNENKNWDVSCENCFPIKNAEDAAIAAKNRAVCVSLYLPTSQKKPKGRPMMGTKRSGYRKKMDGTVERRS